MVEINDKMIEEIKRVIIDSKQKVTYEVNNTMLYAYWNVGKIIVENEQNGNIKAEYGKQIIKELSKELRKNLGCGFSVSNLFNMRKFYIIYPKFQTVSRKLSWSHYCELLSINNQDERNFYEKECVNSNWSVRELKKQIDTSLFERLLLSNGKSSKKEVAMEYALGGLENNLFASTYTYYIPNKEELITEVEKVLNE